MVYKTYQRFEVRTRGRPVFQEKALRPFYCCGSSSRSHSHVGSEKKAGEDLDFFKSVFFLFISSLNDLKFKFPAETNEGNTDLLQ